MGRVSGKVAIVTGGASGIGEAIAERLVGEGAELILTDIREAEGQATADRLGASFFRQDVADENNWADLIAYTKANHSALDILVNNAGIGDAVSGASPEDTPLAEWQRINSVNACGVYMGCKTAIPVMQSSGGGSIINMSSIAALVATPFLTAYGASKAAVRQLTMSVAAHCAQNGYNIRCNSVHPGQISTPMLETLLSDIADREGVTKDDIAEAFKQKIPLGHFGKPVDIANAVLYLASDEASYVTGTKLLVDGGMYNAA